LAQVQEYLDLSKKAEAGDESAATELLIRQIRLDWFDLAEARKRADELKKVSSAQKKEIAQLLIDLEVRGLAKDADKAAAGVRFAAMYKDKEIPAGEAELYLFWTILADHAEAERDKKLFKKVVSEFEGTLPSNDRNRKALKDLEDRLDKFPTK
jgi:hypothetical protein